MVSFNVGDFVFAKVFGHSPWPARVTGFKGKTSLALHFFGTSEIGFCPPDRVWPYDDEHKKKFIMNKRPKRHFNEGIEEIEAAIKSCAPKQTSEDWNDGDLDSEMMVQDDDKQDKSNSSGIDEELELTEMILSSNPNSPEPVSLQGAGSSPDPSRHGLEFETSKSFESELESCSDEECKNETTTFGPEVQSLEPIGRQDAGTILDPFCRIQDEESTEQEPFAPTVEDPDTGQNRAGISLRQLRSAKSSSKLNKTSVCNEDDHLAKQAQRQKASEEWLNTERELVQLDSAIKRGAHFQHPDPELCLSSMESILELSVAPLMFKKFPDVVVTFRMMQNYVGPIEGGQDSEMMKKIRDKSAFIYNKIHRLFDAPQNVIFYQWFEQEVEKFQNLVEARGMTKEEVENLVNDDHL